MNGFFLFLGTLVVWIQKPWIVADKAAVPEVSVRTGPQENDVAAQTHEIVVVATFTALEAQDDTDNLERLGNIFSEKYATGRDMLREFFGYDDVKVDALMQLNEKLYGKSTDVPKATVPVKRLPKFDASQ